MATLNETDVDVLGSLETALADGGPEGCRAFYKEDGEPYASAGRLVARGYAEELDSEPGYLEIAATDAGLVAYEKICCARE